MPELLGKLEDSFLSQSYIDVEINSLEDAYINIAKEEEKLSSNHSSPAAQESNWQKEEELIRKELERYTSIKPQSSFCG